MYTVTRWMDEKTQTMEEVEKLLLSEHLNEQPETGYKYMNWKIDKIFDENKIAVFNGRNIIYNYYTFSVDQIPSDAEDFGDGTYTKKGFIIPYYDLGKIRYIISRHSYAMTLLRKMLFYTGRGEIVKSALPFSGDMFVWLISKVYRGESTISSENDSLADLIVEAIKGFKGDTEDLLAKVSMSGQSVMNIISALSFLIESQNLNQITMELSYRKHNNFEVSLHNRGTISFDNDKYLGELSSLRNEEILATCFLLLYTEILPIIIQEYQSDLDVNQWGQGKCVSFIEEVAKDLSEKISMRISDLNSRPEQLKMKIDTADNSLDCL